MFTITRYRTKPFMTKTELTEVMELFGGVGEVPGTVAHYIDVSGGGGWIIVDTDDPTRNFANTMRYAPYLELETTVVLPVDAAVPGILEALG